MDIETNPLLWTIVSNINHEKSVSHTQFAGCSDVVPLKRFDVDCFCIAYTLAENHGYTKPPTFFTPHFSNP